MPALIDSLFTRRTTGNNYPFSALRDRWQLVYEVENRDEKWHGASNQLLTFGSIS
jgi:hypothetical protein